MLSSIIRLPVMCSQYQKALRSKIEADELKRASANAIDYLQSKMQGQNVEKFMGNLLTNLEVEHHIKPEEKSSPEPW